jgi:hypothetical protein
VIGFAVVVVVVVVLWAGKARRGGRREGFCASRFGFGFFFFAMGMAVRAGVSVVGVLGTLMMLARMDGWANETRWRMGQISSRQLVGGAGARVHAPADKGDKGLDIEMNPVSSKVVRLQPGGEIKSLKLVADAKRSAGFGNSIHKRHRLIPLSGFLASEWVSGWVS